ncbi:MAG: hypothetical protein QE269_11045 [Fimbriimonas sp.]|nr:hypothetical protein [Fimbriimonas sp.]
MTTKPKKRLPSLLGGNYTWNNDSTLASYPGPGYTRKLSYDEEGRLTKIDRDNGTTITPVFEYGYGFDGNRRWRKDLAGNTWDWYPCGVACCAGELVTMRSTNGGATWNSNAFSLAEGSSINGMPQLGSITNPILAGAGSVKDDSFGINRVTDKAAPVARLNWMDDEDLSTVEAVLVLNMGPGGKDFQKKDLIDWCKTLKKKSLNLCYDIVKELHGNTCQALWNLCMHLGRHGTPGGKERAKMCLNIYNASACSGK